MPSENKTTNYGLNQWQGNEYPKRTDFNEDNSKIDAKLKELEEQNNNIISIVVIEKGQDIPIPQRKEGRLYFKTTDTQSGDSGFLENIKVSPTMGLKIL